MRRGGVLAASLLAGALALAFPRVALADDAQLAFLQDKLRESEPRNDVRVRTSAALALGNTNHDGASAPLCTALSDSSELVRQAAAVAMKRLNRLKALDCLKAREPIESDEAAKVAITRAIEAISTDGVPDGAGGGGGPPIKDNPSAKYYVAISTIANSTGRVQTEVEKIVVKAIRDKLDASGIVQLAPPTETADKARAVMKQRNMKGFYLSIAIDKFDYSDGNLKVKIKIGVCNYPGKSIIGSVDKSLSAQGVSSGDKASEDRLMELAAGLASEQFTQNASAFL